MRFITCTFTEHDLLLVALAAGICIIGAWITVRLFLRCRESNGGSRFGWVFLSAVAAGSTVWCTHFVAMLAYRPGVAVAYGPELTGVSLAVAILASGLAFAVASAKFKGAPAIGGAVFGAGVAIMHYTGMAAFIVDGVVEWDAYYVAASLVLAVGFGASAFVFATYMAGTLRREIGGATLLVLAIVMLHFTGMAAMTIIPFAAAHGMPSSDDAHNAIAIAVAGVGLLVLGTGLASYLLDRQATERARSRLSHLMESSIDGAVIEQDGEIIDVNSAFEELVGDTRAVLCGRRFSEFIVAGTELVEGTLIRVDISQCGGALVPVEIIARREHSVQSDENLMVYSVRDLRQRLAQEQRIAHLAHNDSLTGLPNRASFLEHIERSTADITEGCSIAILAIDLDRFKEVNDIHGHAAGDFVLRILSERMSNALGEGEFIARLGGDEFIATKQITDRMEALEFAGRLEKILFTPVPYDHTSLTCGAAIGIALYPENGDTTTALLNNADLAMYRAKGSVTEAICCFEEQMDEIVRARRQTTLELREALARGQLELHYQLQASVKTGDAVAFEALLRWEHPERGFIPPSEFIPLAEESGLIIPIGAWVLRTACAAAAKWETNHKVAVNLSAVQLGSIELPNLVHEALLETGLSPHRLELEVTETALVQDAERATHVLRQIKALGVSVAMDDFGVGYSSLSTLRAFPFDKIKLDKSFMADLNRGPQARAIIRAVLALGESLNIPILAEGVETEDQLAFLKEQGCDEVQGFLLGRPARTIASHHWALTDDGHVDASISPVVVDRKMIGLKD